MSLKKEEHHLEWGQCVACPLANFAGSEKNQFGWSVAIGNGRIVVGVPFDDHDGSGSGSAYIFDLDGTQLAKITASDGAADDYFG